MDEALARFLMVVETVGLVCITALTAYWMKLRHERRQLESRRRDTALAQEVDELRASTEARLDELENRIDFSERLLARREVQPAEPRIPTPV